MARANREVKTRSSIYACAGDKRGLASVDELHFVVVEISIKGIGSGSRFQND